MSFNDKKWGFTLPTRQGTAIGSGGERKMLDSVGGAAGYRKAYRTNQDGSVTRLSTRNGQPEFITTGGGADTGDTGGEAAPYYPYMESGQLEWTYPGEGNPTRYLPATWHFLDIPVLDKYLGFIKVDGAQHPDQLLAEGQNSRAVGTPVPATDPNYDTPARLAKANAEVADGALDGMTVTKKIVMGEYPASLFSGKMRLYLQCLYGIKETADFPLALALVGSSTILKYKDIQFGLWAHHSPGIVTAQWGIYWLVTLTTPNASTLRVTAYKMRSTVDFNSFLIAEGADPDKAEAYMLPLCTIDTQSPVLVGDLAWAGGSAMAYGWKWTKDGSQARVVTHTTSGSGLTAKFTSRTHTIDFTCSSESISMSGNTVVNGDWMDGWGTFNIFVPEIETTTAPLAHYSLTSGFPRPDFGFPATEIYGYYKDDEWQSVAVNRVVLAGPFPKYTQSISDNARYGDVNPLVSHIVEYLVVNAEEDVHYESETIYSGTVMDISVGASTFFGKSSTGFYQIEDRTVGELYDAPNAVDYGSTYGTPIYSNAEAFIQRPTPPASGQYRPANDPNNRLWMADVTSTRYYVTGSKFAAWTLVIPGGDCEAVYVATKTNYSGTATHIVQTRPGLMGFHGRTRIYYGGEYESDYDYLVNIQTNNIGAGWYGLSNTFTVDTSDTEMIADQEVQIFAWSAVLSSQQGTPGGSYSSLFTVDYTYPFYNRGMYMYTGCDTTNPRYVGSEGIKNPESVNYSHRFVGWA